MLTARERAEQMLSRITMSVAWQDDNDDSVGFKAWTTADGFRQIHLQDGGYPRRNARPLVDYLEECLEAHERERDERAVPRGLLTADCSVVKDSGLAANLTTKYGYQWRIDEEVIELWVGGQPDDVAGDVGVTLTEKRSASLTAGGPMRFISVVDEMTCEWCATLDGTVLNVPVPMQELLSPCRCEVRRYTLVPVAPKT